MADKEKALSEAIATYRSGAAERRSNSVLNIIGGLAPVGLAIIGGEVTVREVRATMPVSRLGGPTNAFGRSQISIPELKRLD